MVRILLEQKQNILIWSKIIFIASRSFLFWLKNSGTKQNNLIWFVNYLRQSRMFLFNPKTNRKKQNILIWSKNANRFRVHFCPKLLVWSKAIWSGLEIVLGKIEHFYIIQKLIDRNKTLWFDPPIIGTKAKCFDLVHLLSEWKKKLIWSLASMFFLRSRRLNSTSFLLR